MRTQFLATVDFLSGTQDSLPHFSQVFPSEIHFPSFPQFRPHFIVKIQMQFTLKKNFKGVQNKKIVYSFRPFFVNKVKM